MRRLATLVLATLLVLLVAAPARALSTPTLSVGTVTDTSIRLNWTDAGNETSYSIRRSTDGGIDYSTIATLAKNVLTFNNTGLTPDTTYFYRVRAHRSNTVLESNTVSATTTGAPPPPQCSDGVNNDPAEDSLVDFPADPGCTSSTDTTESPNPPPPPECSDGVNNDPAEDALIDFPADPGCSSATDTTESPNPPPSTCTGVDVPAGTTLRSVMAAHPAGTTFCLAAGVHEIGTTSVDPQNGDKLIGVPVTQGPNGEINAPSQIHGTAPTGIIRATSGGTSFTLENLDICCSNTVTPGSGTEGRGVNRNGFNLTLTARNVRSHGNDQNGMTADGGSLLENVELDNNGDWAIHAGRAAGIKTIGNVTIVDSYIHHNDGQGVWWDCDAPGGTITDSLVTDNTRTGIWVEISSGEGGGFLIARNTVLRNNTVADSARGGISVTSSRNVRIENNIATNNTTSDIRVQNDSRSLREDDPNGGHNGCSSGFRAANIVVTGNQYGPNPLIGTTLAGTTWTNNTKIL